MVRGHVLLLALLMAAGCLAEQDETDPGAGAIDGDGTDDEAKPAFGLQACAGVRADPMYGTDAVRSQLPEGFSVASEFSTGVLSAVLLYALTCDITIGADSYAQTPIGWSFILVDPPVNDAEGDSDLYLFEWLLGRATAPALFDWLEGEGWTVRDATFQFEDGGVTIQGEVDYTVRPAVLPSGEGPIPTAGADGGARLHHAAGLYLDERSDFGIGGGLTAAALEASEGVLSEMGPASVGRYFPGITLDTQFWAPGPGAAGG